MKNQKLILENWREYVQEEEKLQEGILDRAVGNVKSFASGITDPISRVYDAARGRATKGAEDPETRKKRAKLNSLLKKKIKKLTKLKDDLENDIDVMEIDRDWKPATVSLNMLKITLETFQDIVDGNASAYPGLAQLPGGREEEEESSFDDEANLDLVGWEE
jgi:hypothetical protein